MGLTLRDQSGELSDAMVDINLCLEELTAQNEQHTAVLLTAVQLILALCVRPVDYLDIQRRDMVVATSLLVLLKTTAADSPEDDPAKSMEPLMHLLDACDTRIAIVMAKFVRETIRQTHGVERYTQALCQLHALAIETDDETMLANEYAHTRVLLQQLASAP
ncbi:hypothetical protein ATCC90586_000514 [Pythium insidiosum]|nr:hypothetical protein ATCC90586_000514 [Pythium insidiosum]